MVIKSILLMGEVFCLSKNSQLITVKNYSLQFLKVTKLFRDGTLCITYNGKNQFYMS